MSDNAQEIEKIKHLALKAIDDLKAEDVLTLDVQKLTTIADYMIICSGRSDRHVKSIAENLAQTAKEAGLNYKLEGKEQAQWILLDLNGVIVHIMDPKTRDYYQIEKLWDIDLALPNSHSAE